MDQSEKGSKRSELLNRTAVRRALLKPAPLRIPLTGNVVYSRDYYSVFVGDTRESHLFVATSALEKCIEGLWFNEEWTEGAPASIPYRAMRKLQPLIVHYANELEIRFTSSFEFLLHQFLLIDWMKVKRERIRKLLFNKHKLVRVDRIKILRRIVESTTGRHDYRVSSFGVMTELYGPRWAQHPDNEQLQSWYEFLLASLAESGDLQKESIYYSLKSRALNTLDAYEQEQAKHQAEIRIQSVLASLTAALVFVGFIQVIDKFPTVSVFIRLCQPR